VTVSTVEHLPFGYLLTAAAVLLEVAVFCVRRLSRLSKAISERPREEASDKVIGGSVFAGFRDALSSTYLVNVSLFLLLYAITSTFLYFQQASIVAGSFKDRGSQTAFFASVDLAVNVLTLLLQLFLTGRILRRFGVTKTLAMLPAFSILGFALVGVVPTLMSIAPVQVLRRAGNFAIARPTREILFTVVRREDRYKAKSFIDTVVYRLGDQIGAWSFAALTASGLGLTAVSVIASATAGLWLLNALWLGRKEEVLAKESQDSPVPSSG
jgi:AAA family ATP:ADP antiporter